MYGQTTHTCAMSSYSYVLFRNVSVSLSPEILWRTKKKDGEKRCRERSTHENKNHYKRSWHRTCNPWMDERTVRGRERKAPGPSFPSCRPDIPHQWIDWVLHISSTRSIVLSLKHEGHKKMAVSPNLSLIKQLW